MLEVTDLNVFYGDIQTLWNVSISVKEGEIVTLIGANGAGKSTIIRTISGLLKPRKGSIIFNGIHIENMPAHKIVESGISMVPEGRRLFPEMTVLENLEVGASTEAGRKFKLTNLEWILKLFPILKERLKQVAGTLSGGEQQMLAIGRALMSQPRLLLIDEMSLGLSPIVAENILEILDELNKNKKLTIVLVEQDIEAALAIADRAYIIQHGRVLRDGDSKKMLCEFSIADTLLSVRSKE